VHLCQVEVVVYRPLIHRHLPRIQEEEAVAVAAGVRQICPEEVVGVVVGVHQMYPKVVVAVVVAAVGVRQICPEEAVVAVAVGDHHHPCSLEEVEVGEGVRAG